MKELKDLQRVYVVMWADGDRSGWDNEGIQRALLNAGPVFKTLEAAQKDVLKAVNTELKDLDEEEAWAIDWTPDEHAVTWDEEDDEWGVIIRTWETSIDALDTKICISEMPVFE